MAYSLSATKLQAYQRCPQSYYWRYELKIKDAAVFAKAALGTALHEALAQIYRDWHYMDALPSLSWVHECWEQNSQHLNPNFSQTCCTNNKSSNMQPKQPSLSFQDSELKC